MVELPPFSGARSCGIYTAELSRILRALKFEGRQDIARLLGLPMATAFFDSWSRDDVDIITPVPLHAGRERERGFNQSALLARSLARFIELPLQEKIIIRIGKTKSQVGLSDAERRRNLKNAFLCRETHRIAARRVLLVDDVMTTGATVASACRALLRGGALRVLVLTAARTVSGFD